MLPAGRPRKPTALHILNGNPSKISNLEMQYANEPQFDAYDSNNLPKPPAFLPTLSKRCWRENVPVLASQGLLTKADLDILAAYCAAYYVWRSCLEDLKKVGSMIYRPHSATQPQSTYLDVLPQVRGLNTAAKQMLELAREFGMTPAARGRMVVPGAKKEEDEMERLLRGEM